MSDLKNLSNIAADTSHSSSPILASALEAGFMAKLNNRMRASVVEAEDVDESDLIETDDDNNDDVQASAPEPVITPPPAKKKKKTKVISAATQQVTEVDAAPVTVVAQTPPTVYKPLSQDTGNLDDDLIATILYNSKPGAVQSPIMQVSDKVQEIIPDNYVDLNGSSRDSNDDAVDDDDLQESLEILQQVEEEERYEVVPQITETSLYDLVPSLTPEVERTEEAESTEKNRIDIREHAHKLIASNAGKDKYICPVCSKNDLYVNPESGYYECYSGGCSQSSIRDAVLGFEKSQAVVPKTQAKKQAKQSNKAIKLAEFKEIPDAINSVNRGAYNVSGKDWTQVVETHYPYANNQFVIRLDGLNEQGQKDKSIRIATKDNNGKLDYQGAKAEFKPYRCNEWHQFKGQYILVLEGEKIAEICRQQLQIPATTIRQSKAEMELLFKEASDSGVHLAYFRDYDKKGLENEEMFCEVASRYPNVSTVCFDPESLFKDAHVHIQEKYDLEQWIEDIEENGSYLYYRVFEKNIASITPKEAVKAVEDNTTINNFQRTNESNEYAEDPVVDIRSTKGAQYEVNPLDVTQSSPELVILKSLFEDGKGDWRCWNSGFYYYSGKGYWEYVPDKDVATDIVNTLPKVYEIKYPAKKPPYPIHIAAKNRISEDAFKYARKYLNIKGYSDSCKHIAFNNCSLDLTTGEQVEHSRDHLTTQRIDADYVPNLPCPDNSRKFFVSTYGEESLEIIRAFTACFLDCSTHLSFFPYLIGRSGTGKGVLSGLWLNMFPKSARGSGNSFDLVSSPEKRHQSLTGRRLFNFSDMSGRQGKLGDVYDLVDNNCLLGRALFDNAGYEKEWNIYIMVSSVYPLSIENASEGWDRRAVPLPTNERIGKPDPHLKEKLNAEIPQLISWALAMSKAERESVLIEARDNPRIAEKRREIDILSDNVKAFIDRCLQPTKDEKASIQKVNLYQVYQAFCKTQGLSATNSNTFDTRMKATLGKYLVPRKAIKKNGKVTQIPSYWNHIQFVPGLINEHDQSFSTGGEVPIIIDALVEGKLEELELFWSQPTETQETPAAQQIMINDILGVPSSDDHTIHLRVVGISVNDKGQEDIKCIAENGEAGTFGNADTYLRCNAEYCESIDLDPKSFGVPEVGSWVEITADRLEKGQKVKSIVYVHSVIDYAFRYQEHKEQQPRIHSFGWRKLSPKEYGEHRVVFGQV